MSGPRSALLAVCVAGGLAATAAPARAGSETASSGPVAAALSWTDVPGGVADPILTVSRDGATVYQAPVQPGSCRVSTCDFPERARTPNGDLHVADLDGDGQPEVVADVFTGGGACCDIAEIVDTTPAGGYAATSRSFEGAGFSLRDANADGRPDLVSFDLRFADLYAGSQDSFLPPRALDWSQADGAAGHLVDVTRTLRGALRANAGEALHQVRHGAADERPTALAAYVADEYRLGQGERGLALLREGRRLGAKPPVTPRFRRRLLATLHRFGLR